jgi:hypothetical protein
VWQATSMNLAIMQPYFFPYIGYFQLMNAVDEFVIYDNIKFTKQGWINRNRILVHGTDSYITLPLRKDFDCLDVRDRYLADNWITERKKMLNRIIGAYRKAPQFNTVHPLIEQSILFEDSNLFRFVSNSLGLVRTHLGIRSSLIASSTLAVDHTLKAEEKVIAICKSRGASVYVNPIGGVELYSKEKFKAAGIELRFLKSEEVRYPQFEHDFVPWLSIVDVMMFNSQSEIQKLLVDSYSLV